MKKILKGSLGMMVLLLAMSTTQVFASVVYDATPNTLPPNAPSQPFQAQQTFEFGDYVHLGGTDRNLTTVTVSMSDWALYSDYSTDLRYMNNSSTWSHPITINIYSNHLDPNGVPDTLLATRTQNIDIPWRPAADPTCSNGGTAWRASDGNCYNGFAFNALFDLSSLNVTLPNDIIVSLAYNTQSYGLNPIGDNGPYNSLNVLVPNNEPVTVGSDDSVDKVFWNTITSAWYADGGVAGFGIFRQDTNWTPNGTISMQINAKAPECNVNATQDVVSDTTTTDEDGNAVLLSFVHPAWDAIISGAKWIWATDPVVTVPNTDVTKTFTKTFNITGTPTGGTLYVAADNSYTAKVNGNVVPVVFNQNNFQTGTQDSYDVSGFLVTGANTLEITVTNWGVGQSTDPAANPAGLMYKLSLTNNECEIPTPPTSAKVTIDKFVNGVQATAENTGGASFPMHAIYPGGEGDYALGPVGFNNPNAYQATTSDMPIGSTYSTFENLPTSCTGSNAYMLAGYSTGTTLLAAQNAPITLNVPNFTNLQGDKFVIVWNTSCQVTPPTTLKVHILKYLDGVEATATSASSYQFPMTSTWNAANIGAGTGSYPLGTNFGGATSLYGADTASMSAPADYTTSEVTDATSQVVASANQCVPGKYLLNGYRTSAVSFADAATQTLTASAPAFTGLTVDQYVIVSNLKCPETGSLTVTKNTVGGDGTFNFTGVGNGFNITTTSGTGSQTINGLTPGTYNVVETSQSGWIQNTNGCASILVVSGQTATCTVTNTKLGTISGMKFNDLNRNGIKDLNEPGLQGWVIRLLLDDPLTDADTLTATATTDANGNYTFTNIAPGTYDVRETHQKGWKRMSKNPKDIVITSGSTVTSVDFGNALKKKEEKDDTEKDDNHDDQSGHYDAGNGKSDYGKDKDKKEHNHN